MEDLTVLIKNLRCLAAQTNHVSEACLGCGHEHGCSVHGCALIRAAADTLEQILPEVESTRNDLVKRLMAAEKELQEIKSEAGPDACKNS